MRSPNHKGGQVTGLEAAAAATAKAVVGRAAREWLSARTARDHRSRDLSQLIQVSVIDRFAQRKLERQLGEIANSVERRLAKLISIEYRDLSDYDRAAVFAEVTAALERADLSDTALLRADADPLKLARIIRARMPSMTGQLGEAGSHLYEVALEECCDCLIRIIRQLPEFTPRTAAELLARLSGVGEQVAVLLERLPVRSLDAPAGTSHDLQFERRYLEYLASTLDEIELFGARVENYRPRAALSAAYISLRVTAEEKVPRHAEVGPLRFTTLTGSALTGMSPADAQVATMRAESALARCSRTLLRGQAGSGKSTLLRWIAVTAGRGGFSADLKDWNGNIPFMIKLRSHADGRLPPPQDFVTGPLAGLMPPGWVHRILSQGRALLLVDGVDELIPARRPLVRQWLRDLLTAYPSVRAIVSSRPAAAETRWLSAEGFSPVILEPMGPVQVRELVHQWHKAIRQAPDLPCPPEELPRYEGALMARLEGGAHLRALATTPLLAAMMCALNLDHATHLPRDRMGLYAAVLDLLLQRRDDERDIPAFQTVRLERDQKVRILQDLAWQLTVFGRAEIATATALKRIADKTASMPRVTATPSAILEHLIQRSGVIREPVPGRIDFIHRTVQDYLAAAQAADNADIEPLIARAHLDQWRETVIMAVGHANAPLRRQLLTGLLDRADTEARCCYRLRLLIAACLETIPDVPETLHCRIGACIGALIPPRGTADARPLAAAGEEMLHRMPADLQGLTVSQAIATVRTTWLINGPHALDRLTAYASDPRAAVQDELVNGWSYFDPLEYAKRVLANAPLHHGRLDVDNPGLLPGVPHLRHLRELRVDLPQGTDLSCLRQLPALTELAARAVNAENLQILAEHARLRGLLLFPVTGDVEDVTPLLALRQLRSLNIFPDRLVPGLDFIRDLPPLTRLGLGGLQDHSDFTPLAGQTSLREFRLHQCPGLNSVKPLRSLNGLLTLDLDSARLGANGIDEITQTFPRLTALQLRNSDWITSLDTMAILPLRMLTIVSCPNLSNIDALSGLDSLTILSLYGCPISDLRPLCGLGELNNLVLGGGEQLLDLSPIAALPKLRRLALFNVLSETDVTPLGRMRNLTIVIDEDQQIRGLDKMHRATRIQRVSAV